LAGINRQSAAFCLCCLLPHLANLVARQMGLVQGCNLAHVIADPIMDAEKHRLSVPSFFAGLQSGTYSWVVQDDRQIWAGLSLSATGSIADVVLWAIARLQMRIYASATFQR